jgi:hypothetical protein
MPGDRDSVGEFRFVLRVDKAAEFDRPPHALFGRHCIELVGEGAPRVAAEQNGGAVGEKSGRGVADQGDRQVGVTDAAEYGLVLLPEAPLHFQPELHRSLVVHRADDVADFAGEVVVDLSQDRERDGANAVLCRRRLRRSGIVGRFPGDTNASFVLADRGHPCLVGDQSADLPLEGLPDHVHAAYRLEHGHLELVVAPHAEVAPKP